MNFLSTFSSVHLVGIGGIGVSGVARFCKLHDKRVSGSDMTQTALTDALEREGMVVHIGPSQASWLPEDCDLLVYSEAVPESAPERQEALRRGIRQFGHFGFMGELSSDYTTVCISGTNGKSTTTAMVGQMAIDAGLSPTVFVGSLVPGWEYGNVIVGTSNLLIVEGDEYKRKMLQLKPQITLITNVEVDHLDVYKDLEDIEHAFHKLCEQTTGSIFLRREEIERGIVCGHESADVQTFGDALQTGIRTSSSGIQELILRERIIPYLPIFKKTGRVSLRIPGEFNMMNALGALAVGEALGISFASMQKTLEDFPGIWRRFERVGERDGAIIYSDYAHHPTAIRGTLQAAREFFPDKRILAVFQPHQHSRTRELFNDFVAAFDGADEVILSEIYGVAGREQDGSPVSSEDLCEAMRRREVARGRGVEMTRVWCKTLDETESEVRRRMHASTVVLVMGAGNIDTVARRLVL